MASDTTSVKRSILTLEDVHPDMKRYLECECYCPGEVYETNGIFYQVFSPISSVDVINVGEYRAAVKIYPWDFSNDIDNVSAALRAMIIWYDDPEYPDKVVGATIVDATDNNCQILSDIVDGKEPDGRHLDNYDSDERRRFSKKLRDLCDDGIVIRD